MADENLIVQVQNMLKEETWTRATISNYTKNNLIELSKIVDSARQSDSATELQKLCEEHLAHTKDSIIALYISGMISLYKNKLDNSALENLVDIFQKNHKESIVVHLCETILDDEPANKFALRTLAEIYRADGNSKVWDLYEKIVKLDFEESDIARLLAEHYETEGNVELAVEYYKKAHLRYISTKNTSAVKETWSKLVSLIPEEIDFFMLAKRKIAKTISEERSSVLLQELYAWYKDNQKWDIAIDIIKQILEIDSHDSWARKELVDCYRGKYEGQEHLEDYIRSSNLNQSFRNVFEAINDFEKHIAFSAKSFVFHRSWGVGIIRKVENDTLFINFGKKYGVKSMALKMAVDALTPLSKDHIWVLKATKNQADLAKMVKDDKTWALKTIIKSFGNSCDFKRIKAELVPAVLTSSEWTSWSNSAKKILETDPTFGVEPSDINSYIVRDHDISKDLKLANEFKAQKQFFARIDILSKYIESDETDKTSDSFGEMFSYFTSFLKSITKINEQVVASFLIVQKINALMPEIAFPIKFTFQDLYKKIPSPKETYKELKDKNKDLRKEFLKSIKLLPDWQDQYVKLFPAVLEKSMISDLIKSGNQNMVSSLALSCFENFKDNRQAVIFFFKECQDEQWFKDANIPYEKQLIALINIIEITFREINNHVDTTENKKINKAATQLLFKDDNLIKYMFEHDEDTVKRMYTLIADIEELDPAYKAQLRNKILEKYPDFKFQSTEEKSSIQQHGMLVTVKKLEEKKAQIEHIQSVEIPKNAKEIAEARAQGDLKENAEYKAAREHQHYLNVSLSKLQEELNRAVVFDPTTITTAFVSFSTCVTLHNNDTNSDEEYTILGPWESDPDNKIISYMSPFGNALLDKKVGETVNFTINEHNYNYTIVAIKPAKS
ncbi:MAG: transcription elongation factor GreA [Treponema sp.]|nr:transcription elongation factor GreA [Treponema sp.]